MARIGPYELIERVGIGGMAEVFKALQPGEEGFERVIAVKRILPAIAADTDFVKMFIDEAKIAVQLQHPNIAQIYDLGRDGGDLYIALEYVPGHDMGAVVKRQAERGRLLPLSFVVYVVGKICEALQYAHFASAPGGHALNFIHRDISPQNILVSIEGAVKVIDFGLAKAAGRLVTTQSGVVKGKLAYLSSEQARGEDIDHRSDIFSLGTCLYEWLTGERLFLRKNDPETVIAVQRAEVPPLRAVRPELPSALQNIVRRALQPDPAHRYQTAQEMQDELMAFAFDAGMAVRRRTIIDVYKGLFPEDAPSVSVVVPAEAPRVVPEMPSAAEERESAEWTTLNRGRRRPPPRGEFEDEVSAVPVVDRDSSGPRATRSDSFGLPDLSDEPSADDMTTGDFSLRAVEIVNSGPRHDRFEEPTLPYAPDVMEDVLAEALNIPERRPREPLSFDDPTRQLDQAAVEAALAFQPTFTPSVVDPFDDETGAIDIDFETALAGEQTRQADVRKEAGLVFEDETREVGDVVGGGLDFVDETYEEVVDDFDDLTTVEPLAGEETKPG